MRGITPPFIGDQISSWESRVYDIDTTPYTKIEDSVPMMFADLLPVLPRSAEIMEIGCNAGRILDYLMQQGYTHLSGIEINENTVHIIMKEVFPDLYAQGQFFVGNAAEVIKTLPDKSYDLVYVHSVLIHIPPEHRSLFKDMYRISRKYIVVLSQNIVAYDYAYDIRKIFERLGCKEIVCRTFYGNSWDGAKDERFRYRLPQEIYEKEKYFLNTWSLRIFIKKC